MAENNGVKCMKHFALEHDVNATTVKDLVEKHGLLTVKMLHGRAKGLPLPTQRALKKLLGISTRRPITAA